MKIKEDLMIKIFMALMIINTSIEKGLNKVQTTAECSINGTGEIEWIYY